MVNGDEILSQSDVDALLERANTETDDAGRSDGAAPSAEAEGGKKTIAAGRSRTDEEVKDILAFLCRKAFVPREKGVRVIWNAHGSIPLAAGYKMEIQGRKYIALGPFGDAHLVVGRIDGEPS